MNRDGFQDDVSEMDAYGEPAFTDRDEELPSWMMEARETSELAQPAVPLPQSGRRRWLLLAAVPTMLVVGFVGGLWFNNSGIAQSDNTEADAGPVLASAPLGEDGLAEADGGLDASGLPVGDDADQMSIRIETPSETPGVGGVEGATATVRADGLVYFEGSFRSQEEADRYIGSAVDIFGVDAIVENYDINPDAASPTAGDIALDKPVLFESGSATIHPDYIPFLEACGDILRLNPHITMSIAAFTDSVGSEEFNLELSQRRAQAVVDFYNDLDIDPSQLVGTGFGEAIPVAGNDSEEEQAENRRAVLQLLNVMGDAEPPVSDE